MIYGSGRGWKKEKVEAGAEAASGVRMNERGFKNFFPSLFEKRDDSMSPKRVSDITAKKTIHLFFFLLPSDAYTQKKKYY